MSTASRVLSPGRGPSPRADERERRAPAALRDAASWLLKVSMADWITLALLGIMLVSTGWSVQLADWGDLPSLLPTLMLGWAAAFVMHRSRLPLAAKLTLAATLGFAIIMWQGSIPADGTNVADRARDAWDRFWAWIAVARDGGISTDTVPFALMFMFASWVTAYTVTALTFRLRNPWAPVVLLTVGLLNNLSFRPGLFEHTFYIFILAAVALFAHLTTVRRIDQWTAAGVEHPRSLSWLSMRDGLLLGAVVAAIAALLPLFEARSETLDEAWDVVKSPITALEDPAARLLSGVDGPGTSGYLDVKENVLAFQGSITLTPEPLMWVTSRYARMLPGKVYDEYTSAGWLANVDVTQSIPARSQLFEAPEDYDRERVDMLVQPLLDTYLALPVGGAYSINRDTEVQYLGPESYGAPLSGGVGAIAGLPADVRDFVFELRFALRDKAPLERGAPAPSLNSQPLLDAAEVSAIVEELLPDDLRVEIITEKDTTLAKSLIIERAGPVEQIGVELSDEMEADQLYTVSTFVSVADEESLSSSTDDYPGWVSDRYLALPASLPAQVRQLANEIVREAGARTPYEKAVAIQAFLQDQEYTLELKGPEPTADGVYYFLFETQDEPCPSVKPDCDLSKIKGYSQYFGSAATVLLRSVGVPARMVAGWATGEYVPSVGKFLIRDEDRHGWTQVYYAGYGWIDLEVTPSEEEVDRDAVFSVEPDGAAIPNIGASSGEDDPLYAQDIADTERLAAELRAELARQALADRQQAPAEPLSKWWYVVPGVAAGLVVILFITWILIHRGMGPAEKAYTKMVRAGRLLGVSRRRWQTPMEYAMEIGEAAPGAAEPAMLIAIEYERRRYARAGSGPSEDLGKRWRQVLFGLLSYRIRSISRSGGSGMRERGGV